MIVWQEYSASVSGATYKFVVCEECKQKYVYRMVRTGEGQGNSLYFLDNSGAERRAQSQASAILKHRLKKECDAVPCPKCGWYQEDMVAKLRSEHRIWLYWIGVGLLFVGVLLGALAYLLFNSEMKLPGFLLGIVALVGMGGGISAIVRRRNDAAEWEPNETPVEERLQLAQQKAEKVKNFERWLEEKGVDLESPEAP